MSNDDCCPDLTDNEDDVEMLSVEEEEEEEVKKTVLQKITILLLGSTYNRRLW